MIISAVIPAYNEEGRIGNVLSILVDCPYIQEVIVVNDGSTDGTSVEAKRFSVKVIDLPYNQGKGSAMKIGCLASTGDWILFLDADLKGLAQHHIKTLIEQTNVHQLDMSIGVFVDAAFKTNLSQKVFSFLSGQRLIRKEILEHIPYIEITRFGVETAITNYTRRMKLRTAKVPLRYLSHFSKETKMGVMKGTLSRWSMYKEIMQTMVFLARSKCIRFLGFSMKWGLSKDGNGYTTLMSKNKGGILIGNSTDECNS